MPDAVVLAGATALGLLWPRAIPYAALLALGLQSNLTHTLSSDGEVLIGLALGGGYRLYRAGELRPRRPTGAAWLLIALNAVVLLSLLVHIRSPDARAIVLATEYFVSRSLLVAATVAVTPRRADRDWLLAIGVLAAVLGAGRLLEAAGAPVHDTLSAASIALLGDYQDSGSWNTFATVLAAAIPCLLALGLDLRGERWAAIVLVALATLAAVAMASAQSRTVVGIFAIEVVAMLWWAAGSARKAAVGVVAVAYVLGSFSPTFGIQHKPVVVTTETLPDHKVATVEAPIQLPGAISTPGGLDSGPSPAPERHLPAIRPDWRSVLDRNYYVLEQSVPTSAFAPRGNRIDVVARSGGVASDVRLVVKLDGHEIARLKPTDISRYYRWVEIPVPDALLPAGPSTVISFSVTGNPDSMENFFIVGGVNARADGYAPRIWSGTSWLTADLSSDPGLQQGTLLVFVNETVPDLAPFAPSTARVVDPSIADRLFLWQTAVRIFEHNPLLGTGFYTFGLVKTEYEPPAAVFATYSNAHSNFFELLGDLGISGPLLFAAVLLVPLGGLLLLARRRRPSGIEVALALALVAFAASSLTQTWVADSRVYMTCWVAVLIAGRELAGTSRAR